MPESDSALVRRARTGDRAAFAALALLAEAPLLVAAGLFDLAEPATDRIAALHEEMERAPDDRRVLAAETRERIERDAEELRSLRGA